MVVCHHVSLWWTRDLSRVSPTSPSAADEERHQLQRQEWMVCFFVVSVAFIRMSPFFFVSLILPFCFVCYHRSKLSVTSLAWQISPVFPVSALLHTPAVHLQLTSCIHLSITPLGTYTASVSVRFLLIIMYSCFCSLIMCLIWLNKSFGFLPAFFRAIKPVTDFSNKV